MARRRGTRRPEATTARRRLLVAGVVFGALLVIPPFAVMAMTLGDGAPQRAADPPANGAITASDFDDRERRQVIELADRAVAIADDLGPAIGGLGEPVAPRDAVEEWFRLARSARAYFAADLTGEQPTKVARGALAEGVGALVESAETHLLALEAASASELLLIRARKWRDIALQTLFVGSVQLDALGHALGTGHHHVTFQAR